jgi:predicted enzyme related to lactoylglutathione lyase
MKTLNHAINWFEIPVSDMQRAKKFYESIFGFEMQLINLGENFKMALFPTDAGTIGGALCEMPAFYHPGTQGPILYLNGNPDLNVVLLKVEHAGGKLIKPKSQISPEHGYMALFSDPEGNRIALHSDG